MVEAAIGGKTPRQLSALYALRLLPRMSAAAALILALLIGATWLVPAPAASVDLAMDENDIAPIIVTFEEELASSTPTTVLTALVIEGMNP